MSVNLSLGITNSKLGKYVPSIDFILEKVSKSYLDTKGNNTVVGVFQIGTMNEKITLQNLNYVCDTGDISFLKLPPDVNKFEKSHIIDTFISAKTVFWRKLNLNR